MSSALVTAAAMLAACGQAPSPSRETREATTPGGDEPVEQRTVVVVERHPHDRAAFTQGLLFHRGVLYESTGQYGQSEVRRVDIASGRPLARQAIGDELFGEGLARVGERLIMLSWKAGIALVFDLESLALIDQRSYRGEGWGLAYDEAGPRLVMSDGSDRLTFRHPETFESVATVRVTENGRPLRFLNELEVAKDLVWANVWQQERIVGIDMETGRVVVSVDARGLLGPAERRGIDVMNGIAYDAKTDLFYLTGKMWPALFAVRFAAAP